MTYSKIDRVNQVTQYSELRTSGEPIKNRSNEDSIVRGRLMLHDMDISKGVAKQVDRLFKQGSWTRDELVDYANICKKARASAEPFGEYIRATLKSRNPSRPDCLISKAPAMLAEAKTPKLKSIIKRLKQYGNSVA